MSKLKPTIGDTVLYFPTQQQIDNWADEVHAVNEKIKEPSRKLGHNMVLLGKPFAATVVADWDNNLINLKVHLDGDLTDRWVTSVKEMSDTFDQGVGYCWCWPEKYF